MSFLALRYRFAHWFFQWTLDHDNDVTFTVAGVLNFTKYKEHTVVRLACDYRPAPKWIDLPK